MSGLFSSTTLRLRVEPRKSVIEVTAARSFSESSVVETCRRSHCHEIGTYDFNDAFTYAGGRIFALSSGGAQAGVGGTGITFISKDFATAVE